MRNRRFEGWAGLALACLLGLLLRARGLDFELPHDTPSDELVMVDQVDNLRRGRPQVALDGTVAPSYPLLGAFLAQHARLNDPGAGPAELDEHLRRASVLRLDLRTVTMVVSWLIVPATWFLARRFLTPGWSTFAALLVATSVLNISNSQMGRSHGPLSALSLLGVLAAMRLGRKGSAGAYVLAGLAAAAAVGYLHSGLALLLPLLAAHFLSRGRPGRASGWWLLAALALLALTVRLAYPFHFEEWTSASVRRDAGEINVSGHRLWWGDFDGSGFLSVLATFYSYDPLLLPPLACGLVALIAARRSFGRLDALARGDLLVAASYALPYLLLLGLYARTAERFVMPLLPYVAVVAAFGLKRVARALDLRAGTAAAGAAALLAATCVGAWALTSVRSNEDTLAAAAHWIREHLDPQASRTFVIPYFTLPLLYGEESLRSNWESSRRTEWIEYLHEQDPATLLGPRWEVFHPPRRNAEHVLGDDPLGWLRAQGYDHVLIQHVRPSFREVLLPELRAALHEEARLLARFTPMRRDDGNPARVDYNYSRNVLARPFVWHLLAAAGMGPTLELYRLGP